MSKQPAPPLSPRTRLAHNCMPDHRRLLWWVLPLYTAPIAPKHTFDGVARGRGGAGSVSGRAPDTLSSVPAWRTSLWRAGLELVYTYVACFREFQKIGDRHPYLISVKWSPGHTGIFGNDLADQLAKHGATLPIDDHLPSVSYRKRQMKKQITIDHRAWWASVERTEYQKFGLNAELKKLPELSLPRRALSHLLTARSQHGDFAEYHERFHPGQATLECPCGRQKSPTHIFYCRKIPGHLRVRLTPDPETAIGKFLGRSYKVYKDQAIKVVGATRPRLPPRTQNASIIAIPLTGTDSDRHTPLGAKLLQLEDAGRESIPGATSENMGAARVLLGAHLAGNPQLTSSTAGRSPAASDLGWYPSPKLRYGDTWGAGGALSWRPRREQVAQAVAAACKTLIISFVTWKTRATEPHGTTKLTQQQQLSADGSRSQQKWLVEKKQFFLNWRAAAAIGGGPCYEVVAIAPGENVGAPPGTPRHASRNGDTIIRRA
ncbi:hypothetical protein NLG97_g3691 [Lecanicillium saksenae]|uniref:Uncharacterized protein n=1 Tax=Lecanicillium saksenae TaxID=468837 RepID=A0ACC1QZ44_9HYPO|nr:hypothetical protein NLG97_g3691 [Lecanicillium saksenae]